ncbi:uncharacterized protein HMPREF1541_10263 [Cyphellophora europaea CBS 101466]|uniref:ATP-dependent DNA helicase n=1 Tax=Cyphellophora europaea (strain CBS 101466) TaxID=1220924 RepID=W2S986_CYPE1|nr:uncharacterized protein HMPREF1541_10263 [Cyphellophora europaea CBS 101466]ETN44593.1 hypothetical protein HMPREF1541_10263 [Cyphellophora europaea CBS 101466]
MDFLDDEAGASGNEDVLVPSSQTEDNIRPRKRRRYNTSNDDDLDDEYDLPSHDCSQDEYDDPDEVIQKSRYDEVTHVPLHAETQKDTFVTQLTQPWSSPTRIRGPRWKKHSEPPSPQPNGVCEERSCAAQLPPIANGTISDPRARHDFEGVPADDDFGGDDPDLLEALISTELMRQDPSESASLGPASRINVPQSTQSFRQTTLFGAHTTQRQMTTAQSNRAHNWPLANRNEKPTHHKISTNAMKTWVYPTNLGTIRDYQYNIVHKGLFHNMLVALPTGLGKTFIAATIMLNWYRWTEDAQIVFVAPTKPLVAQQIEACFHIVGIPRSQTTLLTGEISPAIRAEEWQEKRVFFMTPQTLMNDLKTGLADPKKIVLLVVDEAHKATGNYAYVEVVRFLRRFTESFRVLALTATPGSSVESVQKVIDGLNISRIEIRTEDSMDIRQFVHSRDENLELFDYSYEIQETLDLFRKAAQPLQNKLCSQNAYWNKDPVENTLFGLKKAQDEWNRSEANRKLDYKFKVPVFQSFKALMSLAHSVDLLKYHGIGPFYHKMNIFADEAYGGGKYHRQVTESSPFKEMMNRLKTWINLPDFVGHPKLTYLKEVTLNHFMDAGDGQGAAAGRPPSETRIMVFAHFRDSAEEIVRVLKQHEPMVRPHIFVGQSSTKGSEGMDQRLQQKIITQFKAGTYNVLVATSIGEEGLDIGEVDLIVCYDASKSPIRMLQRMGRTGRKRAGNVHVLLMRGKEQNDFAKAKDNYRRMQELIECGKEFNFHDDESPRIVPKDIQPVVDKRMVEIPVENTQDVSIEPRKRKPKNAKRPPKRFNMPDGVETGFQFLGDGRRSKSKKAPPEAELDTLDAAPQALGELLLTYEEEIERQTRYGEVAGTEPQFITVPKFDAYPSSFKRLTKTGTIGHSKATETVAKVFKNMKKRAKVWKRPTRNEVMHDYDVQVSDDQPPPERRTNSNKPPALKQKRKSSKILTRSSRSPTPVDDDLADMHSFINDEPLDEELAPSTEATSPDSLLGSRELGRKGHRSPSTEEPPASSQGQQQSSEVDLDEELPDLEDIVFPSTAKKTAEVRPKGRATRRVVDSDDDDDQ